MTQAMRKPKAPEANRARILRAALEEFAARGFKGASMDAIAARTHTTRALINYYFGGKEKVYLAVLEQVYADIRQAESRLDLDHLSPVDAIRRIVEFTYTYYLEHEGFVRLVVAENQARGRHLKKSPVMRALNRPIIDTIKRVLERGQREGRFRKGADAIEVHKAIAALGMFNVTNQYTFSAIFQREMGARGDVARRCATVAEIVLRYLAAKRGVPHAPDGAQRSEPQPARGARAPHLRLDNAHGDRAELPSLRRRARGDAGLSSEQP